MESYLDISTLEAVVGASHAQQQQGQKDDGAYDQEDLEFAQRLKRADDLRLPEMTFAYGNS